MRAAWVLAMVLWARPAAAELTVTLVSNATTTPAAPTLATVTASVSGDDPPLEIAWSGLDRWPPCTGTRCEIDLALAGCRRVAVSVTGLSGAVVQDDLQVCAGEGRPPQARLALAAGDAELEVRADWSPGDAPVRSAALWVDGEPVPDGEAVLTAEPVACHAVDLVVVDEAGQVGIDSRQLCLGEAGPQVELQVDPAGFVPAEESHAVCVTPRHALGLPLEVLDGSPAGCGEAGPPPRAFTRRIVRVVDERGAEAVGSALVGVRPAEAPYTYPWAVASGGAFRAGTDRVLESVGGVPPVTFEVEAVHPRFGTLFVPTTRTSSRAVEIRVPDQRFDEGWALRVAVRDARSLETERFFGLGGTGGERDGGFGVIDGGTDVDLPFPSADAGAACTSGAGPDGGLVWLAGLALLAGRRRRR